MGNAHQILVAHEPRYYQPTIDVYGRVACRSRCCPGVHRALLTPLRRTRSHRPDSSDSSGPAADGAGRSSRTHPQWSGVSSATPTIWAVAGMETPSGSTQEAPLSGRILARIGRHHVRSEDVWGDLQAGGHDRSACRGWRGSRGSARRLCGVSQLLPLVTTRRSRA